MNPSIKSAGRASDPTQMKPFCKRSKAGDGNFRLRLKASFQDFINSSMDDHKACLWTTLHKVRDMVKFGGSSQPLSTGPDGEGSALSVSTHEAELEAWSPFQ